ncbi:cytochrome bc1 complex diheme cytochrome c subunit [Phytohabitans kaempferiae]|uniref:C-type cytochrome n=1 Tax=Phytohabitans kaempferiae TaxID=1620943 RepID=A0ABV6MAQ7_9ACTN
MPHDGPQRAERAGRQRPGPRLLAAAAAVAVVALPAFAPPPEPTGPRPSAAPATPDTGQGRDLYQRGCASCHGPDGRGSQRGPTLAGVGAASVDFQLSTGRMPLANERTMPHRREPAFSPEEIDALVRYVATLAGGGPPVPDVVPSDPRAGRDLYLTYCSACHSATGAGAVLTSGRRTPNLYQADPTQIGEAIRVGPGAMPAYGPEALDQSEVNAIAAYVGLLQNSGEVDRGGLPLGRIGPVTEGLVAVLVGLVLLLFLARRLGTGAR